MCQFLSCFFLVDRQRNKAPTFMPYWSFAITGLSEMKVNNFFFTVKGSGMMRPTKMTISTTRRRKTYIADNQIFISTRSHHSSFPDLQQALLKHKGPISSVNTNEAIIERHICSPFDPLYTVSSAFLHSGSSLYGQAFSPFLSLFSLLLTSLAKHDGQSEKKIHQA